MTRSIPELAEHIESIAIANGIEVVPHSSGRAWKQKRVIGIRPVKSEITYCVALHEIGHILGQFQSGCRLEKEAGAWIWAKENSIEWTPIMTCKMRECLTSYLDWQKRRGVFARLPAKDHPLWSLMRPAQR